MATAPKNVAVPKKPATRRKPLKDPAGGLTAAGRTRYAKTEGAHLRPGVTGPADTPQKKVRKGSFLRRHFANPRGRMIDEQGEPTRLALSAHAWGEPVPHSPAEAGKLAAKGKQLLAEYHADQDAAAAAVKPGAKKKPATKAASAKRPK